ncbi:ankyrin, partial [Neocallimastix californiae]
ATSNDNLYVVRTLLEHHADVNVEDSDGNTPLILACQNQNPLIMEMLLQYQSDVHHKNKLGCTGLHYTKDKELIQILLNYKANINERNTLMMACKNELLDVVALLLQYHVDPNVRNSEGHSALSIACMYGNHQIVKLLLDTENINIDNQTNLGDTPLMIACENAFGSVVSLLLQYNANVYLKNHYHQTALHIACSKGLNPIIIQFLEYKKK